MASVLVIDADISGQSDLNRFYKESDHRLYFANSSTQAIKLLECLVTPDFIILENQFGGEHGWVFLKQLRQNLFYKKIPVVVAGSTIDRQAIQRYVQMGVQTILRKPYQREKTDAEMHKSTLRNWFRTLFIAPEEIAATLQCNLNDYWNRVHRYVEDLTAGQNQLFFSVDRPASVDFQAPLKQMQQVANHIGYTGLEAALQQVEENAHSTELEDLVAQITSLRFFILFQGKIAKKALGIEDPEEETITPAQTAPDRPAITNTQPRIKPPTTAFSDSDALHHSIVVGTLVDFAPHFQLLLDKSPISGEQLKTEARRPGFLSFNDELVLDLQALYLCETFELKKILTFVWKTPLLSKRLIDLAQSRGTRLFNEDEDREQLTQMELAQRTINALGYDTVFLTYIILRLFGYTNKIPNAIKLDNLLVRMMARALIAILLCRQLKIKQTTLIVFLSVTANLGNFLLAARYPAFYALNLVHGQNQMTTFFESQQKLFGVTENEIAAEFLRGNRFTPFLAEVILKWQHPEQLEKPEEKLLAAVIYLSDALARKHKFGFDGYQNRESEIAIAEDPVWKIFAECEITMNVSTDGFIQAFDHMVGRIGKELSILTGI
jgi:CheY-like chemotaxis protein